MSYCKGHGQRYVMEYLIVKVIVKGIPWNGQDQSYVVVLIIMCLWKDRRIDMDFSKFGDQTFSTCDSSVWYAMFDISTSKYSAVRIFTEPILI